MRIACWIPKAKNTNTKYELFIAFPLQQWLYERASLLFYTYNDGLVITDFFINTNFSVLYVTTI
jgi:hypothetical protein